MATISGEGADGGVVGRTHDHAGEGGEPLPRRTDALVAVGVDDLLASGSLLFRVREEETERRLVGDERTHVVGMAGGQSQPGDRPAAAAHDIGRPLAHRVEHPAHVIGEEIRLGVLIGIVDGAGRKAARIVGHDGVRVSQERRDRGEPHASHGVADEHQHRARAPHLVLETRARDVERVGDHFGHRHIIRQDQGEVSESGPHC